MPGSMRVLLLIILCAVGLAAPESSVFGRFRNHHAHRPEWTGGVKSDVLDTGACMHASRPIDCAAGALPFRSTFLSMRSVFSVRGGGGERDGDGGGEDSGEQSSVDEVLMCASALSCVSIYVCMWCVCVSE